MRDPYCNSNPQFPGTIPFDKQYWFDWYYITALSLHSILLAVKESASFASTKEHSGSPALRLAISSAIEDIKAWPARYYLERPTHLTIEIEQKYSGGGGPLARSGEKHRTGWWILHDDTNNPPVGTFEGERFFRIYPNKSEIGQRTL
jgi:hypothetical protein